jgi:UDP-glucose 4-epimerase
MKYVISSNKDVEIFNLGTDQQTSAREIGLIVMDEMNLKNARMMLNDKIGDGRGWKGDIKKMLLDCSKIKKLGWCPQYTSDEAVRLTARQILQNYIHK